MYLDVLKCLFHHKTIIRGLLNAPFPFCDILPPLTTSCLPFINLRPLCLWSQHLSSFPPCSAKEQRLFHYCPGKVNNYRHQQYKQLWETVCWFSICTFLHPYKAKISYSWDWGYGTYTYNLVFELLHSLPFIDLYILPHYPLLG